MKRVLAIILTFIVLTATAFCEDAGILGEWYSLYYGQRMTLSVEDHTYETYIVGHEDEANKGTWEWGDGLVVLDGSNSTVLIVMDDMLMMTDNLDVRNFTRQELPEFYPSTADETATEESYQGAWKTYRASVAGISFDTALEGIDLTANIDGTNVILQSDTLDMEDIGMALQFSEGALVGEEKDGSGQLLATHTFQLLSDGALCYSISPDAVSYYFIKEE